MNSQDYLPLAEYASKHRVSISTLRRRIKTEDIPFEFKEGKYFILDQPVSTHQRIVSPSPKKSSTDSLVSAPVNSFKSVGSSAADLKGFDSAAKKSSENDHPKGREDIEEDEVKEPVFSTVNRLLTELKKAYTQILQEKEDQILHLREEISDIRTLARVLEEENERLKAQPSKRC